MANRGISLNIPQLIDITRLTVSGECHVNSIEHGGQAENIKYNQQGTSKTHIDIYRPYSIIQY